MKKIILAFFTGIFFCSGVLLAADTDGYQPPIVRVAVIKDAEELRLSIKSEFKITPIEFGEVLYSQKFLSGSIVQPTLWGLKIGDTDFKLYGIRILPAADSTIILNNRAFRGEVDIIRQANRTLLAVNHVNTEDYLKGVLKGEVSHWWPMEALKAQAIAARTFALYQASVNKGRDYDLESSAYSQVYGGASSEKFRTNEAVYKTIGKVLTYKEQIFPAYYHATCAGHTEDASVLWKTDIPALKGVSCGFCRYSPHFYWKRKIPLTDIEKALAIKNIQNITHLEWNNSGRIVKLRIKTASGIVEVPAKDFRQKLDANIIKSTIFKVVIKSDADGRTAAYFEGTGWGHGVGMCQWGAFRLALHGKRTEQILQYYYPGTQIRNYK